MAIFNSYVKLPEGMLTMLFGWNMVGVAFSMIQLDEDGLNITRQSFALILKLYTPVVMCFW